MAVCLYEWLRDWFILVHHLAHQSFTWDWVSKDDKSESLMWSKVSGSDSVWVNSKTRASLSSYKPPFPAQVLPTPPISSLSSTPTFCPPFIPRPSHTLHSPLFQRYMKAMCGSGWLCELGARPHLRSCAEGAHCTVMSSSSPLSFLPACTSPFLSLRGVCKWPLIDRFLYLAKRPTRKYPSDSRFIPSYVLCWVSTGSELVRMGRPATVLIKKEKKINWGAWKEYQNLSFFSWIQTDVSCWTDLSKWGKTGRGNAEAYLVCEYY